MPMAKEHCVCDAKRDTRDIAFETDAKNHGPHANRLLNVMYFGDVRRSTRGAALIVALTHNNTRTQKP